MTAKLAVLWSKVVQIYKSESPITNMSALNTRDQHKQVHSTCKFVTTKEGTGEKKSVHKKSGHLTRIRKSSDII
jgi:hypothetical protein